MRRGRMVAVVVAVVFVVGLRAGDVRAHGGSLPADRTAHASKAIAMSEATAAKAGGPWGDPWYKVCDLASVGHFAVGYGAGGCPGEAGYSGFVSAPGTAWGYPSMLPGELAAARAAGVAAAAAAGLDAAAQVVAGTTAESTANTYFENGATLAEATAAGKTAGVVAARESIFTQYAAEYATAKAAMVACVTAGRSGCENSFVTFDGLLQGRGINPIEAFMLETVLPSGATRLYQQMHSGEWSVWDTSTAGVISYRGDLGTLLPFVYVPASDAFGVPNSTGSTAAVQSSQAVQVITPSTGVGVARAVTKPAGVTLQYFDATGAFVGSATASSSGGVATSGDLSAVNPAADLATVGPGVTVLSTSGGSGGSGGAVTISETGVSAGVGGLPTLQDLASTAAASLAAHKSAMEDIAGSAKKTVLGFEFPAWTLPGLACVPLSLTWKTFTGAYDWCPALGAVRALLAWLYGILAAVYVFRLGVVAIGRGA